MPLPPRVSDLTGFDLLLSVARLGSLGPAAADHGISQPAVPARIRHLEGQLGLAHQPNARNLRKRNRRAFPLYACSRGARDCGGRRVQVWAAGNGRRGGSSRIVDAFADLQPDPRLRFNVSRGFRPPS
jgi:hypothetical protein